MIPKRLIWMVLGAGASRFGQYKAGKAVDRATEQIERKIGPGPAKVVRALPGDVLRVGGAAVASGQVAVTAARTSQHAAELAYGAGRVGHRTLRSVGRTRKAVRGRVDAMTGEWRDLTDLERRRLRAEYLRHTEGDDAAFAALLDVRTAPEPQPLPETPAPVPGGRRRFRQPLPAAPVNRVQRTYRRARKAWD